MFDFLESKKLNNEIALEKQKSETYEQIEKMSKQLQKLNTQLTSRQDFFVETELKYIDTLSGIEFENYF